MQSFFQSTGTHVVLKAEDIAFLAAARMVANCMLHAAGFNLSELRLCPRDAMCICSTH